MPFSMQDTRILSGWVCGGATLAEVESYDSIGLVGNVRFSERARRRYRMLWEWCTFRYSSAAQDQFWNLHGREAFYRRMERARRIARFYGAKFEGDQE